MPPSPPIPAGKTPGRPRVALNVETSIDYGRGVLRGIADYLRRHGPWSIWLEQREQHAAPPAWLRRWDGEGLITRSDDPRLLELGVPTVGLFMPRRPAPCPVIHLDNRAVGRQAIEHLRDRGLRNFAFFGERGSPWSEARLAGAARFLKSHNLSIEVKRLSAASRRRRQSHRMRDELLEWIQSLPKPLGLFACNDLHGFKALDACRAGGLRVPEEVAVVAADNDADLCELADPPLSSVGINPERAGYEAAALLDRMMARRGRGPKRPLLIPPLPVVARRSTETVAVDDPHVARALRRIHARAAEGLNVEDLLVELPISRRSLEHRFRRVLGRTPKAEIHRVRFDRVKTLLAETALPIAEVSRRTGFHQPAYLCSCFKKETGLTPAAYRRRHRTDLEKA